MLLEIFYFFSSQRIEKALRKWDLLSVHCQEKAASGSHPPRWSGLLGGRDCPQVVQAPRRLPFRDTGFPVTRRHMEIVLAVNRKEEQTNHWISDYNVACENKYNIEITSSQFPFDFAQGSPLAYHIYIKIFYLNVFKH